MLRLSIIIPYYNRVNTIYRCLKSININTYNDVEVIIVDDNSIDNLELVDDRVSILRLDSNMGPVAARSYGVEYASGEYILLLDSDDELVENWYHILFDSINKFNDFQLIAFPDVLSTINENFILTSLDTYWEWSGDYTRPTDYILCLKKSVFEKSPIPKFRISELWFIYTIFLSGNKAIYLSNPLFIYHQDSGNQISKQRNFKFLISYYERSSVLYSIKAFLYNLVYIRKYNFKLYKSWRKRLIKESILSFRFKYFLKLLFK